MDIFTYEYTCKSPCHHILLLHQSDLPPLMLFTHHHLPQSPLSLMPQDLNSKLKSNLFKKSSPT